MKNVHEMTELECIDYLAECKHPGWKDFYFRGESPYTPDELRIVCPIQPSLDDAASSLPEGWRWFDIYFNHNDKWLSRARISESSEQKVEQDAPTERLARFRCAVAAWRVTKEAGR